MNSQSDVSPENNGEKLSTSTEVLPCIELSCIGVVQSCFKEKFGIPRQPGLAPSARGRIWISPEFAREDAFAGLEHCSHIWVQFVFHATNRAWKDRVRPPRLGGNKTIGVFASRSPNRPNPLGLSVVRFLGLERTSGHLYVHIGGIDMLDGTPVLDIKPYVPYVDAVADAVNGIAPAAPILHSVSFAEHAQQFCREYSVAAGHRLDLQALIIEILQQDPRPQYHDLQTERIYGMKLLNLNVRWQYLAMNMDQSCALPGDFCRISVLDIVRDLNLASDSGVFTIAP